MSRQPDQQPPEEEFQAPPRGLASYMGSVASFFSYLCTETPHDFKRLFDKQYQAGMIEGAILGSELWHPKSQDKNSELIRSTARLGSYVGYDFNRPREFPRHYKKYKYSLASEGKLTVDLLDEIAGNPGYVRTPTNFFNPFRVEHMACSGEKLSLEQLVEEEIVTVSTYGDAYRQAGVYEHYGMFLEAAQVISEPVHVITPKGNGLIELTLF